MFARSSIRQHGLRTALHVHGNQGGSMNNLKEVHAQIAEQPAPPGIRRILRRAGVKLKPRATFADAEVLAVHTRALAGDLAALKEIVDRVEGAIRKRR